MNSIKYKLKSIELGTGKSQTSICVVVDYKEQKEREIEIEKESKQKGQWRKENNRQTGNQYEEKKRKSGIAFESQLDVKRNRIVPHFGNSQKSPKDSCNYDSWQSGAGTASI
jgi:hypothetical protein